MSSSVEKTNEAISLTASNVNNSNQKPQPQQPRQAKHDVCCCWFLGIVPNVQICLNRDGARRGSASNVSTNASPGRRRPLRLPARRNSGRRSTGENSENLGLDNLTMQVQEMNAEFLLDRNSEVQLVDRIEEAQLNGKLPISYEENSSENETPCPRVTLHLSKHGLKIVHNKTKEVVDRLPLHTLVQALSFEDGFGRFNIAFKVAQSTTPSNFFTCYVFQADSEGKADDVCKKLREVFQSVSRH